MRVLRSTRFWVTLAVVFLSVVLHLWAVTRLPVDFDEPDYVQAGYGFASALSRGDVSDIVNYEFNREHPPLVKLTYGVAISLLGDKANWTGALYLSRLTSALFGVLAVLILALVNPLAGALFAVHTLVLKYTSQAYLEAMPLFFALAAVLALTRSVKGRDRWFWLSAIALGAAGAGKFTYFPVVFPILYLLIFRVRPRWSSYLLYFAAAAIAFWALNPRLWVDPFNRLTDMLLFHMRYSQGMVVQRADYPWYQPFLWVSRPVPWHPQVFFYIGLDALVFWLALAGAVIERRKLAWALVWLVAGIAVLLLWPTKWPQYGLIVIPALCVLAAAALRSLWQLVLNWEDRWSWARSIFPAPPRSFWVLTGLIVGALLVGMVANSFRTALGRMPWVHLTAETSALPSNSVNVVLRRTDGSIALGTDKGLALWTPQADAETPERWEVFTRASAGLPGDDVLSLAQDQAGGLWVGTANGLARYDGTRWETFRPSEFGLRGDQVNALAVGSAGVLWVGTNGGAAAFDGSGWRVYTADAAGLGSDTVLSLAVQRQSAGDVVWFGLIDGISRLATANGEWTTFPTASGQVGAGGIGSLYFDAAGRLWAGSLGGGLNRWDGASWQNLRTSNSDLPNDTVQTIFESEPGVLWVGTALPLTVGGTLSVYDGNTWRHYTPSNSGYSGAEPLALGLDAQNRLWVGTQTAGVEILRLDE